MDLRVEAEERVKRMSDVNALGRMSLGSGQSPIRKSSGRLINSPDGITSYGAISNQFYSNIGVGDGNNTPKAAYLAEQDYKLNGSRARVNSGEFINPRWVPDEEVDKCCGCQSEFDWINRRHHCRHCGKLFCSTCSTHRCLLPEQFGEQDPQRVCSQCQQILTPYQTKLTNTIANHQQKNGVDIASNNSNIMRYMNLPFSSTLGAEIRNAAYSTYNLLPAQCIKDKAIPVSSISTAKGLAFLTLFKAGYGLGVKFGTGLVIARLSTGEWSAPSAIATIGCQYGFLAGADLTDYIVVLASDDAVRAFAGLGQFSVGGEIDVAVGLLGRSGAADVHISSQGLASAYSYSHSRGLYAGIALEGSVIVSRTGVNHRFYGREVHPVDILSGQVAPPRAAEPLYSALADVVAASPAQQYNLPPKRKLVLETSITGNRPEEHHATEPQPSTGLLLDQARRASSSRILLSG